MTNQANILCISDFVECAKGTGWKEVHLPKPSLTQHLRVLEDYPKVGFKANDGVIVVHHWAVLASVEVPPSAEKNCA